MRKSMFVVLALMAGLLLWGFASQTVATAAGAKDVPPGFGKKVAGCFYGEFWYGEENQYTPVFVTLSEEGAWLHRTPSLIFPASHGTWIQVGQREIEFSSLGWSLTLENEHEATWKITGPIEFDENFQTATLSYSGKAYLPEQDPLDPDEEPILVWEAVGNLRRFGID